MEERPHIELTLGECYERLVIETKKLGPQSGEAYTLAKEIQHRENLAKKYLKKQGINE